MDFQKNRIQKRLFLLAALTLHIVQSLHWHGVRLSLMREDIPVSKRLRMGFMLNTDKEYMADLRYILNKNMSIRTHYDSDMGFGAGLSLNY